MKPAARLSAVPLRLHRAWAERGVLFLPLVLLLAPVRNGVESTMALQMLVEFPLVMASGWVASRIVARRLGDGRVVEAVMRMGLAPLVGATLCLMFWMVPLALDLARLDAGINAAKLGSLFVAGARWSTVCGARPAGAWCSSPATWCGCSPRWACCSTTRRAACAPTTCWTISG